MAPEDDEWHVARMAGNSPRTTLCGKEAGMPWQPEGAWDLVSPHCPICDVLYLALNRPTDEGSTPAPTW